jgi:hypothetical protein
MAGSMSEPEYEELKEFLSFYSQHYMAIDKLPAASRPMACLEQVEQISRSKATQGLRQAINDIIEECRHLDQRQLEQLDQQLRSHGVVTLSELRRRFARDYARISKRGVINNDTEYYLVRGIVDDSASSTSAGERVRLGDMLADYEQRVTRASDETR